MKNPEDVKSCNLKIRVTPKEKEEIETMCAARNLTISELIRVAIKKELNQEEDK